MLPAALLEVFSCPVYPIRFICGTVLQTMAFWWSMRIISVRYHGDRERLTVCKMEYSRCLALRLQRYYQCLHRTGVGNTRGFAASERS